MAKPTQLLTRPLTQPPAAVPAWSTDLGIVNAPPGYAFVYDGDGNRAIDANGNFALVQVN